MSRALVVGGTGLIGRAVSRRLLAAGWEVEVTGRDPGHMPPDLHSSGAIFHRLERSDGAGLKPLVGPGLDLLVDCVCFTAAHARVLLPVLGDVASTVMMSSKAVYVDAQGRHVNSDQPPHFDRPITEDRPTMAPGDGNYDSRQGYGTNKVAAEQVLLDSGHPVTVMRASKVHGDGAAPPREIVFVKRILDGRRAVFLAQRGATVDHTTAAANVAALIDCAAANPGRRILNSADPDAPSALEISRAIAAHLNHEWEEILLDGSGALGDSAEHILGDNPWNATHPIILDTTASTRLGYVPAGNYAATVPQEIDWLVRLAAGQPGHTAFPADHSEFFNSYVDYAAEDLYLSQR